MGSRDFSNRGLSWSDVARMDLSWHAG
ncbi:MAG: hypothetical protein QOF10_3590, partial [Kribbellaceae bacterium]|nr:hypothetical protein [Kribbellaceae bacterium]